MLTFTVLAVVAHSVAAGAQAPTTLEAESSVTETSVSGTSQRHDIGVMQSFSMRSDALGKEVRYRVLVTGPTGRGGRLDLLVLLHGASATEDQWDDVAIDDALLRRSTEGEPSDTARASRRRFERSGRRTFGPVRVRRVAADR